MVPSIAALSFVVVVVSASRKRNSKKIVAEISSKGVQIEIRFVFRQDLVFGGPFNNSDFAKSELQI
jgi:uncharacterized lipoprotein YehR (DUF1307 family)